MEEVLQRFWDDLFARPDGPLALRFLLQPLAAAMLAVRDGVRDADSGHSPYLRSILSDRAHRKAKLREGLAATSKVIAAAFILDSAYQIVVLGAFYPGEAIVVALLLGFVPYLVVRGPAARIARRRCRRAGRRERPVG